MRRVAFKETPSCAGERDVNREEGDDEPDEMHANKAPAKRERQKSERRERGRPAAHRSTPAFGWVRLCARVRGWVCVRVVSTAGSGVPSVCGRRAHSEGGANSGKWRKARGNIGERGGR